MNERTFQPWPKIARLNRDIVITEKLDGTNACVVVTEEGDVYAQSRTRIITPDDDNYAFAAWVRDNENELASDLGVGRHFGEWWGASIQRNYGMTARYFSLFNTHRWYDEQNTFDTVGMDCVPILYSGPYCFEAIDYSLRHLRVYGSEAAPGWMTAEGIVIWHTAARTLFKVLLEGDDVPKGVQ